MRSISRWHTRLSIFCTFSTLYSSLQGNHSRKRKSKDRASMAASKLNNFIHQYTKSSRLCIKDKDLLCYLDILRTYFPSEHILLRKLNNSWVLNS